MSFQGIFPGASCEHLNGGQGTLSWVLQGPWGLEGWDRRGVPRQGLTTSSVGCEGTDGRSGVSPRKATPGGLHCPSPPAAPSQGTGTQWGQGGGLCPGTISACSTAQSAKINFEAAELLSQQKPEPPKRFTAN